MKKLLQLFDKFALKFGIIAALIFIPLYPKLPSITVTHTWVYIRLEDFLIAIIGVIFLIQLLRKKATIKLPLGIPILLYWGVGLISVLVSIFFIGPHLANFFPKIALLEYVRRIEYMFLFFAAFFSVKNLKDVRDYTIALCVAIVGVVIYGFGQHFYINLWGTFPNFFKQHPFCFPSYQTGNEEFAKGIPLCLPFDARITSTFGGDYDLAAYMVIVIPILICLAIFVKKIFIRVGLFVLTFFSVLLLIFTASRVSFLTYLIGTSLALILLQKKRYILPIILISVFMLVFFSSSLEKRFLDTIRLTSIVTNSQGQVVGIAQNTLPQSLQNKIAKNPTIVGASPPTQNLPIGSSFITLPQTPVATNEAVIQSKISQQESEKLKLAYGGLEIASVSGSFLIQKALVYDISFTTRFQSEWPRDWQAFLSDPALGTGYSSLTLASDNDYLRLLGETGIFGFISFLLIFIVFGIFLKETMSEVENKFIRAVTYGLAGGVVGIGFNATLIDVFESSKVAEVLWILLGMVAGMLFMFVPKKIPYVSNLKKVFASNIFLGIYLLVIIMIFFMRSIGTFFVADDFTWLKWAAVSTFSDIPKYFINAQGFFYRPLDKSIILILYTFFSFTPQGYHIFAIFIHTFITIIVYLFIKKITGKKLWAFIASLLFAVLPSHGENLFWIATISTNLATLFILLAINSYLPTIRFGKIKYIFALLWGIFALLSYELAVILPVILFVTDLFFGDKISWKKKLFRAIPFILLDVVYFIIRMVTNVVAAGGDYAYNMSHLIQNIIGNTLGYIGLFVFGEWSLPYYSVLRNKSKIFALPIGIISGICLLALITFIYTKRHQMKINKQVKLILFGFLFMLIALSPFLGLGNITERYGYFASIGFLIIVVGIGEWIQIKITITQKKICIIIANIFLIIYLIWAYIAVNNTMNQWAVAGKITYNTLGYFKIEQDQLPSDASLYIVNLPIRRDNAWIFPVGFDDGLWFIYRYDTLHVYKADTIEAARVQAAGKPDTFIFQFDKNDVISQIK